MPAFPLAPLDRRLAALFGAHAYAVGGRVRDTLINEFHAGARLVPKDFDYVLVGLDLEDAEKRLRELGRVDRAGASFPVLKVTVDGETLDVALARRERSTGLGHRDFAVDFGPEVTIADDAARRDFTMNAVSVRLCDGELFAPPGALEDIERRKIRMLSDQTIVDDPLRMLRAIQFASRLMFNIESDTWDAITHWGHLLPTVSAERIGEEIAKMLIKSLAPSVGIRFLWLSGLLCFTFPELEESVGQQQNDWHKYDVFQHLLSALDHTALTGGDLVDRLASLLHDVGKPRTAHLKVNGQFSFHGHELIGAEMVGPMLGRLKFSNTVIEDVRNLVQHHMYDICDSAERPFPDRTLRRFIRNVGVDLVERQFRLREADRIGSGRDPQIRLAENTAFEDRVRGILNNTPALTRNDLVVKGNEVIAMMIELGARPAGFRGDPEVGALLDRLVELVLDDPERNEPATLLQALRDMLRQSSAA